MPKYRCLHIHTDGASRNNSVANPGPAAWGYIIFDESGNEMKRESKYIGNNIAPVAEYMAISHAMDAALALCRDEINVFSDVEWLVKQLDGTYCVKSENIRPIFDEIKSKSLRFRKVSFKYVPRENNNHKVVDKLVEDELFKQGFPRR